MKVYARVRRVLVGDSDLGFVHAVAEDGAEFKMELASAYAKRIKRNDVLSIDVEVERIPEPLSASSSRMTAGPVTASRSAPTAAAATTARPGPGTASREVTGAIESSPQTVSNPPGPSTVSREVKPSQPQHSVTADVNPTTPRRSASSPDPRKRRRNPDRELRRLLGLA